MKKLSRKALRSAAIGLGLFVIVLFILSQEVPRAGELNNVSKIVEWTGMVFLPLFGLNLDLYPEWTAKLAGALMLLTHALLVTLGFRYLSALTYISVRPLR